MWLCTVGGRTEKKKKNLAFPYLCLSLLLLLPNRRFRLISGIILFGLCDCSGTKYFLKGLFFILLIYIDNMISKRVFDCYFKNCF